MRFKPFSQQRTEYQHRIFLRRHSPEELTKGGLILPDQAKAQSPIGTVISSSTPELTAGDVVLFDAFGGREFTIDHETFLVLDLEEVVGTEVSAGKGPDVATDPAGVSEA